MTDRIIKVIDYDEFGLRARVTGIKIKKDALQLLDKSQDTRIIFDFENVPYISTGFARDLFGGLFEHLEEEFNKRIAIRTHDNYLIKNAILKGISTVAKKS